MYFYQTNKTYVLEFAESRRHCNSDPRGPPLAKRDYSGELITFEPFSHKKNSDMCRDSNPHTLSSEADDQPTKLL